MNLVNMKKEIIRTAIIIILSVVAGIMFLIVANDKSKTEKEPEHQIITTTASEVESTTEQITTEQTTTIQLESETKETVKQNNEVYYCDWLDYTFTRDDYVWLCRTTFCEAGNQDLNTQVMVALTILNRFADGRGKTLKKVIYQPNAYSVTLWEDFENYGWTEQVEKAVAIALKENCHPKDMYYFRTEYYHKNFGKPYMISDRLYFSTES